MPVTVSASAATGPQLARRFTVRAKRTGARTFTTTGTVLLPGSLKRAAACNGSVRVVLKAGKRTLSTRTVTLGAKCSFTSRVTVGAAALRKASRVTVQVRFLGNAALKPESAPAVRVRTGR